MRHYRAPFFDRLAERLNADRVQLRVAYSCPNAVESSKNDCVNLPATYGLKVPAFRPFGGKVLYQPLLTAIAEADLVVVEQANRHLLNYWLLFQAMLRLKKLAFWGHGRNRQSHDIGSPTERYKRLTITLADWWFAYTAGTAHYVRECGYPSDRITVVQNAIDTRSFRNQVRSVTASEQNALRARLGVPSGARVGIFCGSLYAAKHIEFLLHSARLIRQREPDFQLLIVGGGPDEALLNEVSRDLRWIHVLGPVFGRDKAAAFSLAEVCLNPGLIGLGILDAFAAGIPVFTTDLPFHSPEIEYLQDNVNGRVTSFDVAAYASAVSNTLAAPVELAELTRGAVESGSVYTVDTMVENFYIGLVSCLGLRRMPPRHRHALAHADFR